jgi:hypothetical protein
MNCTDLVRGRLVEVINQTIVTSNHAARPASLSRDRTALEFLTLKLPTSESANGPSVPRPQTTTVPEQLAKLARQPAKPGIAGSGVKDGHGQLAGGKAQGCPLTPSWEAH